MEELPADIDEAAAAPGDETGTAVAVVAADVIGAELGTCASSSRGVPDKPWTLGSAAWTTLWTASSTNCCRLAVDCRWYTGGPQG